MDLVAGAMSSLVPKLWEIIKDEYGLQKGVRKEARSLAQELESAHAALRKVAEVPPDLLDEQVRVWARELREASYDMEDVLDAFLVRVDGVGGGEGDQEKGSFIRRLREKMASLLSKSKARRGIAGAIDDIKKQLREVAERRGRYTVGDIAAAKPASAPIDPRLAALYNDAAKLVGIEDAMDELVSMLSLSTPQGEGDGASAKEKKVVSVVGFGGLGKTTLAKAVYDRLKADFGCGAFVPVGRNPDLKKVFEDILLDLDRRTYMKYMKVKTLDERQLIDEIRNFLNNKRYLIVIDDIWDVSSWKTIEYALLDTNLGSRIIITTRNSDVAARAGSCYKLKPLTPESSKVLFYRRIFDSEEKCPRQILQVSNKILKKCGGVPLAIITISSLLAIKDNITEWQEVCDSIGSGVENNPDMNDMRKVLSLSYYDLPSHLKTCLLYLSIFPEDYQIRKNKLIRRWIAEDFIQHEKHGDNLFEIGERYFNELINRSMMEPALLDEEGMPQACRVHDIVLDLICSLSREENFVTIPDHIEQSTSWGISVKAHRLSLQKPTNTSTCSQVTTASMSQVRSFTVFSPAIKMSSLSCFQVLRVLDLEDFDLSEDGPLKLRHLGSLLHLRYLGLRGTSYSGELPAEIGQLQFLQTLDIQGTDIQELPSSTARLTQLKCLCFDYNHRTRLRCSWLKQLTSLEELTTVRVDKDSASELVEALVHLTHLRVLSIKIAAGHGELEESLCRALVESLGNLQEIRHLEITDFAGADLMKQAPPPPKLRKLAVSVVQMRSGGRAFSSLPPWLSPSSLPLLSSLHVAASRVRKEDLEVLGAMPALRYLWLGATGLIEEWPAQEGRSSAFVLGGGAFPRAIECAFLNFVTVPSMFKLGAMPMVRRLRFCIRDWDFANGGDLDDLAMAHLPALEHVVAEIYTKRACSREVVVRLEEALKQAEDQHPNNLLSVRTTHKSYGTFESYPLLWRETVLRADRPNPSYIYWEYDG
nr:unnamed protein product [Digitaria exilis]